MIFVVSGEGPSDIGGCNNGQSECSGGDFRPGPMAVVIDRLVEQKTNGAYAPLAMFGMEFVSEARRTEIARALPRSYVMGKKREFGGGYYFKEAMALASAAKDRSKANNDCPVAAVLFRDADGTRSTEQGLFEVKWKSIEDGFRAADFSHGVPMVPKPKSEAWLLCALKEDPYLHCTGLEDSLSGNDNAPESAKQQLQQRLEARGRGTEDLVPMLEQGEIVLNRIAMPSFKKFRDRLEEVTDRMFGGPPPPPVN